MYQGTGMHSKLSRASDVAQTHACMQALPEGTSTEAQLQAPAPTVAEAASAVAVVMQNLPDALGGTVRFLVVSFEAAASNWEAP